MALVAHEQQPTRSLLTAPDAELRLVATLLKVPDKLDEVYTDLTPDMFTDPIYRDIYDAMQRVYTLRGRFTQIEMAKYLSKSQVIRDPINTMADISRSFISANEFPGLLRIVKEAYSRRRIADGAKRLFELATTEEDIDTMNAAVAQETTAWVTRYENHEGTTQEVLAEIYPVYVAAREGRRINTGPTTGLAAFDAIIQEIENGSMLVLGGRTSMGKTATALNLTCGIARRSGWVLYHSLEMTRMQAVQRMVQAKARVSQLELKGADAQAQERIDRAFNDLMDMPIVWNDRRGLTAPELCAVARRYKRERDIKAWVVDYLQLIKMPANRNQSTSLLAGEIVRILRDCAGELNIPIILLSQLNRGVEARSDKRPMMSDLRESGNIEEFADYIVFAYRPGYYDKEKDQSELQLLVEKNRISGECGTALCTLINEHQYIVSRNPEHRRWEWLDDTPEGRKAWW